jgi:hypothetical protein
MVWTYQRMDEHRIPKRVLEMKMSGKRPKGRLRTQWLDQVKERHRKKRTILEDGSRNAGMDS